MNLNHERLAHAAATVGSQLGARLVLLFGSATRKERRQAADLDIGVLADGPIDAARVTNRLIELLKLQNVDVADLRRADPLLLMLAARDGVALYEREPGEAARFASLAARRFADTRKFREAERRDIEDFLGRTAPA